ncbi:MAG: DNA adenine methylase [Anaerolineae bacterium]|nr:DNA adenine methylase [Anaerolineae bacterium]
MPDPTRAFRQAMMAPLIDAQAAAQATKVVNVSTVPQRSPFRYPGGKTWLVPRIRVWLRSLQPPPKELIEPFAGGAIVSLTAVFENLVERATLVELDEQVAAVWKTILGDDGPRLAEDVMRFRMSAEAVKTLLGRPHSSLYDLALATLVKNRVQRGGILAPGASLMKAGENGRGLSSRWYPQTLRKRILAIAALRDRIHFVHGDGTACMRRQAQRPDVAYFIDPPYTVAGKRLYTHSDVDHDQLFAVAATLAGDFLMTYDNAPEIRWLAERHGFQTAEIPMMNTHHATKTELLIGRDLRWVD